MNCFTVDLGNRNTTQAADYQTHWVRACAVRERLARHTAGPGQATYLAEFIALNARGLESGPQRFHFGACHPRLRHHQCMRSTQEREQEREQAQEWEQEREQEPEQEQGAGAAPLRTAFCAAVSRFFAGSSRAVLPPGRAACVVPGSTHKYKALHNTDTLHIKHCILRTVCI